MRLADELVNNATQFEKSLKAEAGLGFAATNTLPFGAATDGFVCTATVAKFRGWTFAANESAKEEAGVEDVESGLRQRTASKASVKMPTMTMTHKNSAKVNAPVPRWESGCLMVGV
jgi:hypothetical protein